MTNYNEFEKVLNQIVYYFNPCKTEQLTKVLTNTFKNIDKAKAKEILYGYETNGHILLSADGWAMTKGKYTQITGDTKEEFIKYEQNIRIPNMAKIINEQCSSELKYVDILWILIDLLPDSLDYSTMGKPFDISFISKNKLYQVISIRTLAEDAKINMLKSMPNEYDEDFKRNIVRIAIMENPEHAFKVPNKLGFKFVLSIDSTQPRHYKIIEKRENIW